MEKIDLKKVGRLNKILSGEAPKLTKNTLAKKMRAKGFSPLQIKAAGGLHDPLQREIYLFHFKTKFHQVESGNHKILTEEETKNLLAEAPEAECFYLCSSKLMCPLPSVFSGITAEAVVVKDDSDAVKYINRKAG